LQNTEPQLLMRRIKMIWDFRGPNAQKIAEHHEVHLKDYIRLQQLKNTETGVTTISDMYSIAFMIVDEDSVSVLRQTLKPHRGQLAS